MSGRKSFDIGLKGRSGNDSAPELLQAPMKGGLDAFVEGDDVDVVAAAEARSVDDVHLDVGVTLEDADDVLHFGVAAVLVEDLQ